MATPQALRWERREPWEAGRTKQKPTFQGPPSFAEDSDFSLEGGGELTAVFLLRGTWPDSMCVSGSPSSPPLEAGGEGVRGETEAGRPFSSERCRAEVG